MNRSRPVWILVVGLACVLGAVGGAPGTRSAPAEGASSPNELADSGVGMYTDASVANQVSSFTINPLMVSCGVGTLAAGGEASGPFAMLMYATHMDSYAVDAEAGEIRATGRMRSITKVAGSVVEDAEHDFVAIAADTIRHGGPGPGDLEGGDRFDVHFQTPFWDQFNPMCTGSSLVEGGCRFGGRLLMGDVAVAR